MTFFGISLFDDVDLPEFPFPDLGRRPDRERAPEGAAPSPPATSTGSFERAWQGFPAPSGSGSLAL
jgi:hypothetical protein